MNNIESDQIERAFKAARFMKWFSTPLSLLIIIISIIIGAYLHLALGIVLFLIIWSVLLSYGYRNARCPKCDQLWWSWLSLIGIAPWWTVALGSNQMVDEVDSMKCRKCGLQIGIHLRKE